MKVIRIGRIPITTPYPEASCPFFLDISPRILIDPETRAFVCPLAVSVVTWAAEDCSSDGH
jgi:hypothetical protein